MQNNVNLFCVTSERFIDRVINNFLRQMVRARGVGVHARALAHRIKTGQNFNSIRVIAVI